jgi:uncharacterized protein (DUF433 family)
MTLATPPPLDHYIEITPDVRGGKPRIAGHRITVSDIAIWHERMGQSADEIANGYNLSLSEVYAALAYYFDHREEIDNSIRESQELIDEMARNTPSLLKQKLYGKD